MKEQFFVSHDLTLPGSAELYSAERGYGFVTGANRRDYPRLQIPETNTGFLPQWWLANEILTQVTDTQQGVTFHAADAVKATEQQDRYLALSFRQDVPETGCYRVTLTITASAPVEKVAVFAGRRRLVWHGALAERERRTLSALCDVSPIIPRGRSEAVCDPSVNVAVLCDAPAVLRLTQVQIESVKARTVYIMGDSTVTDQTANIPYAPGASFGGWGQMLGAWLPEPFCVSNHAHSGLTTESFAEGGHWDVMYPLMKQGDVCLLQFGHNDQKLPQLTAKGGYTKWLTGYIQKLRNAGVSPVLVTPLARNSWTPDGSYNDLLAEYAEAVCDVGAAECVPVIDLHGYSMELVCRKGLEAAKCLFYPGDYTHTNDFGACGMAHYVAQKLCEVLGAEMRPLEIWKGFPPFSVLEPPADCKLTPPENGRADPIKPLVTERPEQPLTRVETLELVIQLMRYFPINVYNDLYDDVIGHETFAGTVQCAAQNQIIPEEWVSDGSLYPGQPVTLADFLAVLVPAYASRRALGTPLPVSEEVPAFARSAVGLALRSGLISGTQDWLTPLTRSHAAEIAGKLNL